MKDNSEKTPIEKVDCSVELVIPNEPETLERLMLSIAATKHSIRKDQERLQELYLILKKAIKISKNNIVKTEFYRAYLVKDGYKLVAKSDEIRLPEAIESFNQVLGTIAVMSSLNINIDLVRTSFDMPRIAECSTLKTPKGKYIRNLLDKLGLKIEKREKIRIKSI